MRGISAMVSLALLALVSPACSASRPEGAPGPAADELARKMERAVRAEAWQRTGAVAWVFAGKNRHLWDRQRHWSSVEWSEHRALLDLTTGRGRAFRAGVELSGDEARSVLDSAHAKWVNDSFWLNPVVKAFDEGVVRRLVPEPEHGHHQLLVEYTSGGRTPGDRYLWILSEDGTPRAWRMWTSNVPVKGTEVSWERWVELPTGARVSTLHKTPVFELELTEVRAASTLTELQPGTDPFAPLAECGSRPELCTAL